MINTNKAFSLVELLVSTSIIAVILSVVLFNYGNFNDSLALGSSAQEMAITIRQAQTYGINVKESTTGTNQFNYAFGINFSRAIPTAYYLFVDTNSNSRYDAGEAVETVQLRNGVRIVNVCDGGTNGCVRPVGAVSIVSTFLRPNPDARIYFVDNASGMLATTSAKVQLVSPKGTYKYVIIESTGQVTVQ